MPVQIYQWIIHNLPRTSVSDVCGQSMRGANQRKSDRILRLYHTVLPPWLPNLSIHLLSSKDWDLWCNVTRCLDDEKLEFILSISTSMFGADSVSRSF